MANIKSIYDSYAGSGYCNVIIEDEGNLYVRIDSEREKIPDEFLFMEVILFDVQKNKKENKYEINFVVKDSYVQ